MQVLKERPILFSGPMVRAILENRKSMTRRIIKPQPCPPSWCNHIKAHPQDGWFGFYDDERDYKCPYGQPGDRLWVRETHYIVKGDVPGMADNTILYRADPETDGANEDEYPEDRLRWKPSIHMPRWASRLTLEIVSVRVERVQEIHWHDALREGIVPQMCGCGGDPECGCQGMPIEDPTYEFQALWNSINGPGSWEANPWVWVIEFKKA